MRVTIINEKEVINLKESKGDIWQILEGGKVREKLCDYIIISNIFLKKY